MWLDFAVLISLLREVEIDGVEKIEGNETQMGSDVVGLDCA
jgi:hypothetical protein